MSNITYVDKNDTVIGYGPRLEALEKGIIHRISRVFLFNSRGEILIQKRSAKLSSLPNRWDQSAAGHVDEGENYEMAAIRELKEEVGVTEVPLKEAFKFYTEETDELKIKKRFNTLYIGIYDGSVQPDSSEVSEVQWINPIELLNWMERSPGEFTKGFILCFKKYLETA